MISRWLAVVLVAVFVGLGCDGGDGGEKGPGTGKDLSQEQPDSVQGDDTGAAKDSAVGGPDGAGDEDGSVGPVEEVREPVEDLVPQEDVVLPPEEIAVPEDTGVPGEDAGPVDLGMPPEDVATSQGACDNPADMDVFEGTPDLSDKVSKCVMSCIMNPDVAGCSKTCIQDATGLSSGCSQCFGDVVACTVKKCMMQCIDSGSPACADCREKNCGPAFEECAGVPMT